MQCEQCPQRPRRWRAGYQSDLGDSAVFGAGATTAKLAFVAEGPGATEVAMGEPLVGPTGHWFRTLLGDAGLRWDDIYRTNAILCEGPGKGSELTGPAWGAVACCSPSLQHEARALVEHGVRVFVAMGNAALQGLLPGAPGIVKARGYVYPLGWFVPEGDSGHFTELAWMVPTLHPSPKNLKGNGSGWALVVNDIRKAARIASRGAPLVPTVRRILAPTLADLRLFFARPRTLAADIENTMDGRLVCEGFHDGEATLVVPILMEGGGPYWSAADWPAVAAILREVHQNPAWKLIFQNGVHDVTGIEAAGLGPVRGWVLDTMLAHHATMPDQRHSLHHLGSLWFEGPPWKNTAGRGESTAAEEMD